MDYARQSLQYNEIQNGVRDLCHIKYVHWYFKRENFVKQNRTQFLETELPPYQRPLKMNTF